MKSSASKFAIALLCGAVVILLLRGHKLTKSVEATEPATVVAQPASALANQEQRPKPNQVVATTTPAITPPSIVVAKPQADSAPKTKEEASLDHFIGSFVEYTQRSRDPKKLVRDLQLAGLKPVVTQNFNPDTGKMLIIRTGEALPGTRYFHAQFFEDENKQPYLQHMSFEFRPGPDAMDKAVKAVEAQFAGLGKPSIKNDGYVQWQIKNDYIVWVKRMSAEDLKNDPFNAYTKADAGTVRLVVDEEIHGHDDDSHVH
jgi:hypothetical protein